MNDHKSFRKGDRVRFRDETFLRRDEGLVIEDRDAPGSVRVMVKIFGRDVQLDVPEGLLEKLEQIHE